MSIILAEYAINRSNALDSLYQGSISDFRTLMRFMESNHWFKLQHKGKGQEIMLVDCPAEFPALDLWLKGYKRMDEEKYSILVEAMSDSFSSLIEAWEHFRKTTAFSVTDALNCLDYMISMNLQLPFHTAAELEDFLSIACASLPRSSAKVLIKFCCSQKQHPAAENDFSCSYSLVPSDTTNDSVAIPFSDFAHLAWIVFDESNIQKGHYIEKAAHSRTAAETWFIVAMEFISALRIPDIQRLPIPKTPEPGDALREKIVSGEFSISELINLVNNWLFLIENNPQTPSKTKGTKGVTRITVSLPTKLFPPFGKILGILASYHEEGDLLVKSGYVTGCSLENFFGEEFNRLCGSQYFLSTRRLNKAYLQGIEYLADHDENVPISGYLLSSLLRSHKMHYGELSRTTDTYLKDGDFAGISPSLIASEMFERGVFGFIPVVLLSHYAEQWHSLSLHNQTIVIQELALSPTQLEHVTQSLEEARHTMMSFLKESFAVNNAVYPQLDVAKQMEQMLCRIAGGAAPSKCPGSMCLRSAAGISCVEPMRSSCLGCQYEIWTRTGIHLLLEEYLKNKHIIRTANTTEKIRLQKMNECYLLPALKSIVACIRTLYSSNEVAQGLADMIQRRIDYAKD